VTLLAVRHDSEGEAGAVLREALVDQADDLVEEVESRRA
jgi:hypothetical protein